MPRRCLVIGPMNKHHMPKLRWLAEEVVGPILKPRGFTINTPDVPDIGNIMYNVIKECDRAQLVVADVTGNNPNVLYEMAVLDAMGRACIPVKISDEEPDEQDKIPFDRAQYRYFSVQQKKPAEASAILRAAIDKALEIKEKGDLFENPLTDYFGVPLSSFSSAFALARGYYQNLLKPTVKGIVDGKILDDRFRKHQAGIRLLCIIPEDLEDASRESMRDLVEDRIVEPVTIEGSGRKIVVYTWCAPVDKKVPQLLDIPTTMVALRETVLARLGKAAAHNVDPSSEDFREVQEDEVSQFHRYLKGFVMNDREGRDVRKRVDVVFWSQTALAQHKR